VTPEERAARVAEHRGHTVLDDCDPCRRARRVWPLALYFTPTMADPPHPDDDTGRRRFR
jgi:hypothetical protein